MGHIKIVLAITLTMAITIAVTAISLVNNVEEKRSFSKRETPKETLSHSSKSDHVMSQRNRHTKFSRFLMEKHSKGPYRNPNAADHCNKNPKICDRSHQGGVNSTMACCGNKCVDLTYDDDNCGACKKQCKFTQTCCRGQCIYLAYDKRHCGQCNHRCPYGEFCVYGLCNYA